MVQRGIVGIALVPVCAATVLASDGLAVQKPFETDERHRPKIVMGRDYWTFMRSGAYNDPGYVLDSEQWKDPWFNPALTNVPCFRDCALVRETYGRVPPVTGKAATWRTVLENCGTAEQRNGLVFAAKKDHPLVVVFGAKRYAGALAGDISLDYDDWTRFKAENPNLICTRTLCEWGWDIVQAVAVRTKKMPDCERRRELEATWKRFDMADRYDRICLCKWYVERMLALHYGDRDTFMAFRSVHFLDHVAAAFGAKYLVSETTNTTLGDMEYRWDISCMFVRGAARQFGLPWGWYEANYFNGPAKDGTWLNNSVCRTCAPVANNPNARPEGGTSASAQRRCWYYAWLNGANAVEPEAWSYQFFTTNTPSGMAELSTRGRNFSAFHDFTETHRGRRGIAYAPVAILVPFAQGYTAFGNPAWGRCPVKPGDYAMDALFFTIAPGWERAKGLKAGIQEGNLHNSRFAMMYDVLVPDSPQPKEEFRKALFAYPAAILVGEYADRSSFEDVLVEYEKAGGRLVRIDAKELPPYDKTRIPDIRAGRIRFPSVQRKLETLQRDLFPFEVSGDCQYGVNRTEGGWWLWMFNNRGVRKFADTFETIDHSFDSRVRVGLRRSDGVKVTELVSDREMPVSDGVLTYDLPAGYFAVFEISMTRERDGVTR